MFLSPPFFDNSSYSSTLWVPVYKTTASVLEDVVTSGSTRRFIPDEVPLTVRGVGPGIPATEATSEFIGMIMLTEAGCRRLHEIREVWSSRTGEPFHEASSFDHASLTDLLQEVIETGGRVSAVGIYKGWMEIDTFLDYQRAWADRGGDS